MNKTREFASGKEKLLDLATEVGSPGFLLSLLAHNEQNDSINLEQAALLQQSTLSPL
jgi:hypothetical protein